MEKNPEERVTLSEWFRKNGNVVFAKHSLEAKRNDWKGFTKMGPVKQPIVVLQFFANMSIH